MCVYAALEYRYLSNLSIPCEEVNDRTEILNRGATDIFLALLNSQLRYDISMIMIYNGKKVGHSGPEETTYIKQGVG